MNGTRPKQEKLDRNTTDLVGELRIAAVGIQVLFAFLLVVPFNAGWKQVNSFQRDVYFIALLCIATAAVLLIAPTIHHRLLSRRHQKAYLVDFTTRLVICAGVLLAIGLVAIMVMLTDYLFGGVLAAIVGAGGVVLIGGLWFAVPLVRRREVG